MDLVCIPQAFISVLTQVGAMVQVCTRVEAPKPKPHDKPKPPKHGLPKTIRHSAPASKAPWSEAQHQVAHHPMTYLWRQHGYLCPTELSFFKEALEPSKLTTNLQHMVGDASVWSGDGAQIGASMLASIQGVLHDAHVHPLHVAPEGHVKELEACTCPSVFTKPPKKTSEDDVHVDGTTDLCMEWDVSKVAAMPQLFRVSKSGYLQLRVGSMKVGARKQPKYEFAHRVVLNMLEGVVEGHNVVCHTCDNKRCLNPMHMLWGTHAINRQARGLEGRALIAHYSQLRVDRKQRWGKRKDRWGDVRQGVVGVCAKRPRGARRRG